VAPTAAVRRAAVLGHPIAHSLSPVLHRSAYHQLGLDWRYDAIDVEPERLQPFMADLGAEWVGLSLTMPLKETVLGLLDVVDTAAADVRAVNTVVFAPEGSHGYNTDIGGLTGLLGAAGDATGTAFTALVIGAGATARSTMAALAARGAGQVAVSARQAAAAAEVVDLGTRLGVRARPASWPVPAADLGADVVVNTVPAAAAAGLEVPSTPGLLVDVLYDPWPTPLASRWAHAGGEVVGGLELLVRQAVEQVALMTGRRPDADLMRQAGLAALAQR
jgi:shikimate dehydrogenase